MKNFKLLFITFLLGIFIFLPLVSQGQTNSSQEASILGSLESLLTRLQQIFVNLTVTNPQNQLAQVVPPAANHYIRAREDCVAQGRHQGDGTGWGCATSDNGAGAYLDWNLISWVRGDTYYVAGSSNPMYTSYTYGFVLPVVSGTSVITIKKANDTDNASDPGYSSTFATTQARWEQMTACTSYLVFDGVTGGGPNSWKSGFGFLFHPTTGNSTPLTVSNPNGLCDHSTISHQTFKHIEMYPYQTFQGDYHDSNIINGSGGQDPTSYFTGQYLYLHNSNNDCLDLSRADHATLEYSACGPFAVVPGGTGHQSGTRTDWSTNVTIRYNWYNDVCPNALTGGLGIYDGDVGYNKHIYIYGNVFSMTSYCNGQGPSRIVYQNSGPGGADDVLMYNNSFLNMSGNYFYSNADNPWTNSYSKNNLLYKMNSPQGTPQTHGVIGDGSLFTSNSYGYYEFALYYWNDPSPQVADVNPYVGLPWQTGVFALATNTQPGTPLTNVGTETFDVDMYGHTRTTWSRGAVEYTGNTPPPPSDTTPPAVPTGLRVN